MFFHFFFFSVLPFLNFPVFFFLIFVCLFFSLFSFCSSFLFLSFPLPGAPLQGSPSPSLPSSPQNIAFPTPILISRPDSVREEERRRKKKEELADRNKSLSTIARTGTFYYSRAWKPLTPTYGNVHIELSSRVGISQSFPRGPVPF